MSSRPVESQFLNARPVPGVPDYNSVLVLGSGSIAIRCSERLVRSGYDVVLASKSLDDPGLEGVTHVPGSELKSVHGFVGSFRVVLETADERLENRVGFIASADSALLAPKFKGYGLSPSERVLSLSQLEDLIDSDAKMPEPIGEWFKTAFLCGLHGAATAAGFARVLERADTLQGRGIQAHILMRDAKVAGDDLERRYRNARFAGALFYRFAGVGPVLEKVGDTVSIVFQDPVLNTEMELIPDLIVVDERYDPPGSLRPLLDAIPSASVTGPFLQPESIRFNGVSTAKAGIFAIGPARGEFSPTRISTDLDSLPAAMSAAAGTSDRQDSLGPPPEIDSQKCAVCLTCVRLCPHGAMTFYEVASADSASCARCGICAAACPMDAISLKDRSDPRDRIWKVLSETEGPPKIAAFLCRQSAAHAMEAVQPEVRDGLAQIVVPCAGALDTIHILNAFQLGAEAVLVAGCFKGNCASVYGTVLAGQKASLAGRFLEEAGIDPDRVRFVSVASNTPGDLAGAVAKLRASITSMETIP